MVEVVWVFGVFMVFGVFGVSRMVGVSYQGQVQNCRARAAKDVIIISTRVIFTLIISTIMKIHRCMSHVLRC